MRITLRLTFLKDESLIQNYLDLIDFVNYNRTVRGNVNLSFTAKRQSVREYILSILNLEYQYSQAEIC